MYQLDLTPGERDGLEWLAERYESALTLAEGLLLDGETPDRYWVPEHVAWDALEATRGDGGAYGVVPCAGGGLATQLDRLFDSIV